MKSSWTIRRRRRPVRARQTSGSWKAALVPISCISFSFIVGGFISNRAPQQAWDVPQWQTIVINTPEPTLRDYVGMARTNVSPFRALGPADAKAGWKDL